MTTTTTTPAADLLDGLRRRGFTVRTDGRNVFVSPKVGPKLRTRLAAAKVGLLSLLLAEQAANAAEASSFAQSVDAAVSALSPGDRECFEERAGIREFEGGMPRPEAERAALADVLGAWAGPP